MCQAKVFLNGKVIMEDVLWIEPVAEGVRLMALFEPVQVVPAVIRQIDLMKHRVILDSLQDSEQKNERDGKTKGVNPALDGA
jgi:predicted RNA-binding protein